MLFIYNTKLSLVVLAALALYTVLRLSLYRVLRQKSEAVIQADANENSIL